MSKIKNIYPLIVITSMMFFLISCKGDIQVTITGLVDSINGTKVRLTNADYSIFYDSTVVKDNQFKFNSSLPKEDFYKIDFESNTPFMLGNIKSGGWGHPCLIYLEKNSENIFRANGKYEILHNYYSIKSSSPTQQKLEEYYSGVNLKRKKLLEEKRDYRNQANIFLQNGNNEIYKKYLDSASIIENKERLSYQQGTYEFIKINPSTLITPYLITEMPDFFENYSLYKNVLDELDPEIRETEYAQKAYNLVKAVEKLRIGGEVPQIYGNDVYGKPFNYDYSKRKYTLIDIWASWCVPCRYQTPQLKEIYKKYKNHGFDIVAVSVDKSQEWWIKISKYDGLPWYNVSELVESRDSKNVENFVAKVLPMNYLVDNEKKIIGRNFDLEGLDKFLRDSL